MLVLSQPKKNININKKGERKRADSHRQVLVAAGEEVRTV
jgi:hypothetical protein